MINGWMYYVNKFSSWKGVVCYLFNCWSMNIFIYVDRYWMNVEFGNVVLEDFGGDWGVSKWV